MISVTLGELAADGHLEFGDGYRTKRDELADSGFRIIRVADIKSGTVSLEGPDFVSRERGRAIGSKAGRSGDILLTTKGTVGRVAVYEGSSEEVVYSPQLCFFRVDPNDTIDARFLRYWFSSPEFVQQAAYRKSNTDMADYINLSDIRSLRISLPPLGDQASIAEVLAALDDKIAANRGLIDQLRSLAQALFMRAMVEDPVLVKFGEVAEFHNRKRVPLSAIERESMCGSVPYYGAAGVFGYVNRALFDEILVLIGEDGSVVTDDGRPVIQYVWGPAWVNNHAHVVTGSSLSTEILLLAIERANIEMLVTGAVQPKLSMGNLKRLELAVPGPSGCIQLDERIQSMFAMIRSLSGESRHLGDLRDALLPRLMSGKLRVRDAEDVVSNAV
ncbi:restriction endonuclease subunit S [Rhodococcus pyridinivorans]